MISKYVVKYCNGDITKIKNYELAVSDEKEYWEIHHWLEITPFSKKEVTINFLEKNKMYYNVEPQALVFLKHEDHVKLHESCKFKV